MTLKIGMIGLDTSHVSTFAKILSNANGPHHVPGGRIVAGYPGASPDFALSTDRVEGFTKELRDDFGALIVDSAQAVADAADLVFITAVDGHTHLSWFEQVAPAGKPVFIDKPFTASVTDAQAILKLADRHNVTVMSCSSLRYGPGFTQMLADDSGGTVVGCDVCGPMQLEDALPGFFWYGCHSIEMLVAAMGVGYESVRVTTTDDCDLLVAKFPGGRIATMRGMRSGHASFQATIHRSESIQHVDPRAGDRSPDAEMLAAILASLPNGRSAVPREQMLEVVKIMEAGNAARGTDKTVAV
ncbi:MAG: Gfo/Idh/MocA family oxidoreductase [Phycisphaeraceae bacterium]|nr:Gfo/Idh/MocA family oxidoreductase [Phycisphaeraceae bacterium]